MYNKTDDLPKTMVGADEESIKAALLAVCKELKLASGMVDRIMSLTDADGTVYECFYKVLREELDCRHINSIAGLISAAKFPRQYELSD